ncbi:MAG: nitroreductase family protein [Candidatus Hermodarchaeota archaeon]
MDVEQAIKERRAYRALNPVDITEELIQKLARAAQLAPSCFNNQPSRFVFIHSPKVLEKLHPVLTRGNKWVESASLIIVVYSQRDLDCKLPGRDYYLFDTGLATAFLILQATEMGLVAHPIAGFDDEKVKEILDISKDMTVITLVIVGKHSETITDLLSEKQASVEKTRPPRKPLEELISIR